MFFVKRIISAIIITIALMSCSDESVEVLQQVETSDESDSPVSASQIINEIVSGKTLTIYLPPNYDLQLDYKVVYFLDGQALWNATWDMENKLNNLIDTNVIEPIVLVGIHTSVNRTSDLVPYSDPWITQNWGEYEPNAQAFSELIHEEIIPFVEQHYAVSKTKTNKAFFGYSLGGLHTMWDGIHNNDKWGMIGALSPSFWVDNFQIFYDIQSSSINDTKFWFDIGTGEWNYYVPAIDLLTDRGVMYGNEAFYLEVPDARHSGRDWSERIHYLFRVFAGIDQDYTPVDWTIEVQFILSQSGTQYYKRINPIIKTANGIEYSASSKGSYELLNPEAGEVLSDGRFSFTGEEPLNVKVSYRGFEETITITDIE